MIILQERNGIVHVIEHCTPSGYLAMCSRTFSKGDIFNTFAANSPIANICSECTMIYKIVYDDDLTSLIRTFKSSLPGSLLATYNYIKDGVSATHNQYWFLGERYSEKILRYHRKLKRKKLGKYLKMRK